MDKLNIAKAKELRGEIIRRLYDLYGSPVQLSSLGTLLRYKSYNSREDIGKAVRYLSGAKKEYLEVDVNEKDYWASFVQLSPTGVNLAEGDLTDMGVIYDG